VPLAVCLDSSATQALTVRYKACSADSGWGSAKGAHPGLQRRHDVRCKPTAARTLLQLELVHIAHRLHGFTWLPLILWGVQFPAVVAVSNLPVMILACAVGLAVTSLPWADLVCNYVPAVHLQAMGCLSTWILS
jgi:hypothetical protein